MGQDVALFCVGSLPCTSHGGRDAHCLLLSGRRQLQKQKRNTALFDAELVRYVIKNARVEQSYMNVGSVRKTAITTRVMELVHQVCLMTTGTDSAAVKRRSPRPSLSSQVVKKGIHITKRDLFYTDVNLFKDQRDVCLLR